MKVHCHSASIDIVKEHHITLAKAVTYQVLTDEMILIYTTRGLIQGQVVRKTIIH